MYCILIMVARDQHTELSSRSTRLWIGITVSIGISQVIMQKAWLWIIVVAYLESAKLSLHTRFVNSRSIVTTTKGKIVHLYPNSPCFLLAIISCFLCCAAFLYSFYILLHLFLSSISIKYFPQNVKQPTINLAILLKNCSFCF
jgi:hypothetical protein